MYRVFNSGSGIVVCVYELELRTKGVGEDKLKVRQLWDRKAFQKLEME